METPDIERSFSSRDDAQDQSASPFGALDAVRRLSERARAPLTAVDRAALAFAATRINGNVRRTALARGFEGRQQRAGLQVVDARQARRRREDELLLRHLGGLGQISDRLGQKGKMAAQRPTTGF